MKTFGAWLILCGFAACAEESQQTARISEAKAQFPAYIDLHEKVIVRSCGPTAGVCHNTKEFPDLHTPANMLGAVEHDCNVQAISPLNVENVCEPLGDILLITSGIDVGFEARVGWIEEVVTGEDDEGEPESALELELSLPVPSGVQPGEDPVSFSVLRETAGGGRVVLAQIEERLITKGGETRVVLERFHDLKEETRYTLTLDLNLADPNRDGIYGATEPDAGQLIVPGDPDRSYIMWRVLGLGRAPRMPLAGDPLTEVEVQALRCWIHNLEPGKAPSLEQLIDYEACAAAEEAAAAN
jgi:hypothetical protein